MRGRHPAIVSLLLERGATTFWESFDPDEGERSALDMYGRPFATSLCHGWSGAVAASLARHLLGVEILAPGFARVRVAPALGDLESAEGRIPTPRGDLVVRASRDGVRVVLPSGVERADG
jgi:alpha-L-rhamnosidase